MLVPLAAAALVAIDGCSGSGGLGVDDPADAGPDGEIETPPGLPPPSPGDDASARDAELDGPATEAGEDAGEDAASDGGSDASDAAVDAGADVDSGPPPGPLSPSYVDYDINHVLVTGQSNSVANGGTPVLTNAQPYTNVMFNTGVMPISQCDGDGCKNYQTPASLSPLVEGDRFFNYMVETPSAGLANEISKLAIDRFEFGTRPGYPQKHDVLVSVSGRSGNTYWCLRKGSCSFMGGRGYVKPYDQAILDATSGKARAQALGKTYAVRAVATIHGESDHYYNQFPLPGTDGTPNKIKNYSDGLLEWQADLEKDIKAVTGQAQPIPLFVSGLSGWNNVVYSPIPVHQLDAHVRAPGKVVLIGPTYMLPVKNDCLHFDAHGSRRLGEYFAKVYARVVLAGQPWEPVRPMQITRAGNVITVKYHVPKPPLVLDTTRVTNPGDFGFQFLDDSGSTPAITSVAVTAPDTVTITLAAPPTGPKKSLRYALKQNPNTCIGPGLTNAGGARGNVRDSDDTPSVYGYDLHNWGVQFDLAVP